MSRRILENAVGYCDNENYKVRFTGTSIWVFDNNDNQIARFRDAAYVYKGKYIPGTNRFIAKSNEGDLLLYDLERLRLIKKVRRGLSYAQDGGFDISSDGQYLYNVEYFETNYKSRLAVYDANSLNFEKHLFQNEYVDNVECWDGNVFLLFLNIPENIFICKMVNDEKQDVVDISERTAGEIEAALLLRDYGYSKYALEESTLIARYKGIEKTISSIYQTISEKQL